MELQHDKRRDRPACEPVHGMHIDASMEEVYAMDEEGYEFFIRFMKAKGDTWRKFQWQ